MIVLILDLRTISAPLTNDLMEKVRDACQKVVR